MALDPASGRRSASPESSGRDSPVPRQWRNQLSAEEIPTKDKHYRKYASGIDRALGLFETALDEWADYISFLNRLLKALQARHPSVTAIPAKAIVAKRLSQCLNPSLPSGVHQKTLEVYNYVFSVIGKDGLSRDLPLYLPGLAPTLSFASLSVRTPFLDLLERYFLRLNPNSLRPAMKSVILALLPGLEEETAEDFDRTLKLMDSFKNAIRPDGSEPLTSAHSSGDDFFWQCFFLASITSHSRRPGALVYLVRNLPKLGHSMTSESHPAGNVSNGIEADISLRLSQLVTSPEPGLLLRCFAKGLADEQLLIQRGFLDLLVTHLPLHSRVLQDRVKPEDLQLLLNAAVGVVTRRDMSLNRRLWSWLLGPDPTPTESESGPESPTSLSGRQTGVVASRTGYFEEYGLQPLSKALLSMIKNSPGTSPSERARPYRICLSLMDRWEIGGLVVPEVFLPIVGSVRKYRSEASSKMEFIEVLRSASVFFDGVESGLIYGELLAQIAQAIGPGNSPISDRLDKLSLVKFILVHFNVREEEMITIHAPLTVLAILCMLEDMGERGSLDSTHGHGTLMAESLSIAGDLLELVPERAFPEGSTHAAVPIIESKLLLAIPGLELLKKVKTFYVNEQGNLDLSNPPFAAQNVAELLLQKTCALSCNSLTSDASARDLGIKCRLLMLLLSKTPHSTPFDARSLLTALNTCLEQTNMIPFTTFSSTLFLSTHLFSTNRILITDLSEIVTPLVRHAWSFLSASDPKYHVETVRSLWHLQTALTPQNRDIESAIASLMVKGETNGAYAVRPAESGRSFGVIWSHTLQDNPSGSERRASKTPKTPNADLKMFPRLSGTDNYEVMLTRPLFLVLDALLDERTQLFMSAKSWLNSMIGIDKLFIIFVSKFIDLAFLHTRPMVGAKNALTEPTVFTDEDDLDLALYFLRSLSNVFRWAPDAIWGVLATRHISAENYPSLSRITGGENDITLQHFFLQICMRCLASTQLPEVKEVKIRATQLARSALTVLHQILLSPYADALAALHLEEVLIDQLLQSLQGPDPYVQVLLLDVVFASLKLREIIPVESPSSPKDEKKALNIDPSKSQRLSFSAERAPRMPPPPPSLLKCLQAGLASSNSRPILESWISFLSECLPLYSDSIFQVLIPLVETLCSEISGTFANLQQTFKNSEYHFGSSTNAPESTLISLLNGLEQVLAKSHDNLLAEEARAQVVKSPDQPQGFLGNMVSSVFSSDAPQSRSATANDRLTVLLAIQDAVRICFTIWSWGQSSDAAAQDTVSASSFNYTSLRMRNRARRLLEHLFAAETLHCLETVIEIWRYSLDSPDTSKHLEVFNLLPALDGSRPKHTIPAIFNAIYSRTNPSALDPSRKSTLTVELQDTDITIFLVDYARSLDDDAMDEIWQDCLTFLRDILANPFPHRQTLPSLLEFAAILGEKVDNTNFGEQRKMRRELGDLFLRLLTALFTTRPMNFTDTTENVQAFGIRDPQARADDVVGIVSSIIPNLPKILVEPDRVLNAATTISTNIIGPTLRSRAFPDTVSKSTLVLMQELSRLPNNQKTWKKDVTDAFNDSRFFGSNVSLVQSDWLPLLRQWTLSDKERLPEILGRITPPATAGIVFGVGATSARQEADRKTQLNLRRIATLVLASADDAFVTELPSIQDKLVELLGATTTSSPSSTTRAELFMVVRALVLKTTPIHLAPLWPVINAELHAAISSVAAPDNSAAFDTYNNASVLQACKLLDLLICAAPDDFQLHEWLFVTDTIDAVYRSSAYEPVALADELSEELASVMGGSAVQTETGMTFATSSSKKRPMLGQGGINDDVSLERRDELVVKVLRPFFSQLSIFAFESTYALESVDWKACVEGLLKDLFDERSIVKAL